MRSRTLVTVMVLTVVAAGAAWFASAGCAPHGAEYTKEQPPEAVEHVMFLDNRIGVELRVDEVKAERTESGRLVVKLTVFNKKDGPIECRVKYKFKGEDGFVVDETGWMPVVFDRREITHLEQKSLSPKAADFTVLIRYEKVQ